jgi:hypothetical protein
MPWIVKSKAKKAYREAVGWTARLARGPGTNPLFSRCQIQYEIIIRREPGGYLPRDADNATASLKSAQDGMKDACLFSDDSHDRVRVLPPIFTKPGKNDKRSGIKVTVTAWENEK